MNAQLREKHFENLRDPCAMEMYDGLCSDYERLYGAIPASAQTIICDIAVFGFNGKCNFTCTCA